MVQRRVFWLAVVIFFLVVFQTARAETIWGEGFESHDFAGWSFDPEWSLGHTSQSVHSGEWAADIRGPTSEPEGSVLECGISTTGFQDISLGIWGKVREGLESADSISVEWWSGESWSIMLSYSGIPAGDWQYASVTLPPAAGDNGDFRLRLRATLSGTTDRMNFDDLILSGVLIPEPTSALLLFLGTLALLTHRHY